MNMNSETRAACDASAVNQARTFGMSADFASNKDRLVADLKLVMADAEKIIKQTASASNESFALLKARLDGKLTEAKAKLKGARHTVEQQARQATSVAQTYVKANPWQSAALAIAAGIVLGFCLGRQTAADASRVPLE